MSFSILKRKDNMNPLNSYLYVYDTKPLSSIDNNYKNNILRIVKKAILGTNFTFWYSKHTSFITAIVNFIIINTCFVIFPQLIFHSNDIEEYIDDILLEAEEISKGHRPFIYSLFSKRSSSDFVFRLFISNLIDSIILITLTLNYRIKEKKINKYMTQYTTCAIESENSLISDKYHCKITDDENFNIEINLKNDNNLIGENCSHSNNKYFFEYVINFPNIKSATNNLYKKAFLPKEREIINRISGISNEIENKYKNKLLKFLFIIITMLLLIPLFKYASKEKRLDYFSYFSILALSLFVQRNIFLNNKNEQIKIVSLLNQEYMNDGYYIYLNNDMISVFYLKEEFRNIEYYDKIRELNEKFLNNFQLI